VTPISALIAHFYPEEKIKSESKVFFTSKDLVKLGNIPVGGGIIWNAARLVETDKNYYFDQRISTDYWVWFCMGSILFIIPTLYLVTVILQSVYPTYPKTPIGLCLLFISLLEIAFAHNIAKVYCDIGQISLIKKDWVSNFDGQGDTLSLKGKVPKGEIPMFVSQAVSNKPSSFPVFVRFLSKLLKGANFLTGKSFNINCKPG